MSKDTDPIKERLDALAKKTTSKPAGPPIDPEALDQILVTVARAQADAQALRTIHKEEQARLRQVISQLTQSVQSQSTDFKQALKSSLSEVDQGHQKALHQWADRLEELAATNRIMAKGIFLFTGILCLLLAWEILA